MNRKQHFLQAVRTLAPNDDFIQSMAQYVEEETLSAFPGGAALEFVSAMHRWFPRSSSASNRSAAPTGSGQGPGIGSVERLSLSHALRVRSAEYWLELGDPEQALKELEQLSELSRHHPAVIKTRIAAMAALRERGELSVQE